jgi:hypothetical protein
MTSMPISRRRIRTFALTTALMAVVLATSLVAGSTAHPVHARFSRSKASAHGKPKTRARKRRKALACPAHMHRVVVPRSKKTHRPKHTRCVANKTPKAKPSSTQPPSSSAAPASGATGSLPAAQGSGATTPEARCALFAAGDGSDSNRGTQSSPFRSLHRLAVALKAGQTGCLQSGQTFDSDGNLTLNGDETHAIDAAPITISSSNPAEPATITHSLTLEHVNDVAFTDLDFSWALPRPWVCWSAQGNPLSGKIISGPGACTTGSPGKESAVQLVVSGANDSFTDDDITNDDTNICVIAGPSAEGARFEDDHIHNCGPPVEPADSGFQTLNEEPGWHAHGVYDFGHHTIISNDYIYDNSRDGVLLYGGGNGAIVEHNIIDHNGAGVWFGSDSDDVVAWNIITNSTSPRGQLDYGIGAFEAGSGDVASDNCLDGNQSGEIDAIGFTSTANRTATNPQYADAEQHEYDLKPSSPCLGYGPASAQP